MSYLHLGIISAANLPRKTHYELTFIHFFHKHLLSISNREILGILKVLEIRGTRQNSWLWRAYILTEETGK